MMFFFIDKIKQCNSIPRVQLKQKIGQMSIKYKNNDDLVVLAGFYLGSNGAIYTKYVEN